jgi:hypothetical protein
VQSRFLKDFTINGIFEPFPLVDAALHTLPDTPTEVALPHAFHQQIGILTVADQSRYAYQEMALILYCRHSVRLPFSHVCCAQSRACGLPRDPQDWIALGTIRESSSIENEIGSQRTKEGTPVGSIVSVPRV